MITIKSQREIELMKEAGRIVAHTLKILEESIRPGISTYDLDKTRTGDSGTRSRSFLQRL